MINKQYEALVVDLDGTLIGRDEQITKRVAKAIDCVSRRLPVSIATGREASDVLDFARQLRLTAPQISDNGALMLDPACGEPIWSSPLQLAQAEKIITLLRLEGLSFIATYPGGSVRQTDDITRWDMLRISALDMDEITADALLGKFLANSLLDAVKVALPYNGKWAVDLTSTGVNKGTAVRQLALKLDISTNQIIVAGDSYNDIPLFNTCGLNISMS